MEDHFWPAVYPGIIIGLLLGLAGRSIAAAVAGAVGGFAGAAAVYAVFEWSGLQNDFLRLVGLLAGSALVAYFAIRAVPILFGTAKPK